MAHAFPDPVVRYAPLQRWLGIFLIPALLILALDAGAVVRRALKIGS